MIVVIAALRTELVFVRGKPRLAVGIGGQAQRRLADWLNGHSPAGALVTGFCGALQESLGPGTVVLADSVVEKDEVLGLDPALLQRARAALPAATVGHLLTVASPAGKEEKARLNKYGVGIDMESAGIVRELRIRQIPLLIARVVLDRRQEDLPHGLSMATWAVRALLASRKIGRATSSLIPVLEGTI
jgi:nucleoside phosphorylase